MPHPMSRASSRSPPSGQLCAPPPPLRGITRVAALKAHLAAEPETGIITATELSPGNSGDAEVAPGLLSDEPAGTEHDSQFHRAIMARKCCGSE